MKKVIVSLLVASSVFAISSCSKSTSTPSSNARVMLINGCSGSSAFGLTADSVDVPNAAAVNYRDSSGYQNVKAGTTTLGVYFAANFTSLGSFTTTLIANNSYSLFVGGLIQNSGDTIFFATDDLTAPTSGDAKIRLVNTCSDPAADTIAGYTVTAAGLNTPISTAVPYGSVSGFIDVPAGTYTLKVGSNGANAVQTTIDLSNVTLSAGKIYTVMFSGYNPVYFLNLIANN
jgi:hypothetical protein